MAHFHRVFHVFPDVERTAFLHPNYLEVLTVSECVVIYLCQCLGKFDLSNQALAETVFPNALNAVRNFGTREIFAAIEHPILDVLQGRRKRNVFDCTICEDLSFVLSSIDDLLYA